MKKEKMTNTAKTPVWQKTQLGGGFTLVELLVVIAIMAALAVAVVVIINPAEFIKRGRDSTRLSDLASLNRALGILLSQNYDDSFGDPNIVYTSLPDTDDALPEDCDEYSLPSLPDGWSYSCRLISNFRQVDGSGWTPVDLTAFSAGSPLAVLPVDPVNSVTTGKYYTYVSGGSWHMAAAMESNKYKMGGNNDKVSTDGGSFVGLYEVGTNFSLLPVDYGDKYLFGYWNFNEESGITVYDRSGFGKHGTLVQDPQRTSSECVTRKCISFSGSNYINLPLTMDLGQNMTVSAWFKTTASGGSILGKYYSGSIYSYRIGVSGGKLVGCVMCYNTSTELTSSVYVNNGSWHHAALTYDGSRQTLYFDGVVTTSSLKSTTIIYPTGSFALNTLATQGYYSGAIVVQTPGYLNGYIDEVRFYKRALSAPEILAMYNAGMR